MFRKSGSQKRVFLSATSALAIIAGLGGNASAACTNFTGPADFLAFENFSHIDCVAVTNGAKVHGNLSNGSTGVIGPPSSPQPATMSIDNSTVSGAVQNSGQIFAGGGTPGGIKVTGGSVITNAIINNGTGTISVNGAGASAFGIGVSQSSFTGGITNSGVIVVNNSGGSAAGIQVGGGLSPPPPPSPPASINPGSLNTPAVITTSSFTSTGGGAPPPSGKGKHHH